MTDYRLLRLLADGGFHSGEAMATLLGVSRAAIWKQLKRIHQMTGLKIFAVRGRGYRLASPLELLETDRIQSLLSEESRKLLNKLEIHDCLDSTNSYLMARPHAPSGTVCIAEQQTSGRGRRGRQWVSPYGSNLYLSLSWSFPGGPATVGGLSLAAGVALVRTIRSQGIEGVGLKWPNDILWQGSKLAGLLLEVVGEAGGPCRVVLGMGMNLNLPEDAAREIDQPWTDLGVLTGGRVIERNQIAASLLDALLIEMTAFQQRGLTPLVDTWGEYDLYLGEKVDLYMGDKVISGVHRGIDESGALRLEQDGVLKNFYGGEVSLRKRG
ncbi:MAG: bifunctional biotin--[acetyl-CoA-carboxylase] ligase/biotin operon repressor BirA [Gammaproteobacteria bacterium]|nr:bifunctional biotin--[acetyl-CoA-carboxylase] ligase/biotin operon repressor BirA [Gammaproteobacteria bacterium]